MGWVQRSFDDVELVGITRAEFNNVWGVHMQLWSPTSIPVGSEYFKLAKLKFNTTGNMGINVQLIDEAGAPVSECAIAQGWKEPSKELPPDSIPNGGDPRMYPNQGDVFFTNEMGIAQWNWGGGEGFAPETMEGPHWYWIPMGQSGIWTDVVYGFGWRWGTNHYHLDPTYRRSCESPVEPGDLTEAFRFMCKGLSQVFADTAAMLE